MKKIFMLNKMFVGLMLMALAMLAQPVWAQHDFSKPRKLYGYGLDQRYVYFEGRLMSGADARSFEYLGRPPVGVLLWRGAQRSQSAHVSCAGRCRGTARSDCVRPCYA